MSLESIGGRMHNEIALYTPESEERINILPGVSLADAVRLNFPVEACVMDNLVAFNKGTRIVDFENYIINENDMITVSLVPSGGGGRSKGVIGVVLGILVATAGAFFGMPNLVTAGIGMVLSGIGSMLIKPPSLNSNSSSDSTNRDSSYYSITGQSNQSRAYQSSIKVYGRHRIYPALGTIPDIDNTCTASEMRVLYDFGIGACNFTDIRIGDTLAENYNPTFYMYQNFIDPPLVHAYNKVGYEPSSYVLQQNDKITATSKKKTKKVDIDISFPKGLTGYDVATGDLLPTSIQLKIEFSPSNSNFWIPVDASYVESCGVATVDQDSTPSDAKWYPATINWKGFGYPALNEYVYPMEHTTLPGFTWGDWVAMPSGYDRFFNGIRYTQYQHINWPNAVPNRAFFVANIDVYCVPPFPGATNWQPTPPAVWIHNASFQGAGPTNLPTFTITASTLKPFVLSIKMPMPYVERWDFRIERMTAVSTSQTLINDTVFTMLKSYIDGKPLNLKKPHTFLEMYLLASDKISGVVQNLNAIATSVLRSTANGTTFTPIATRNPAWVAIDIMTGPVNNKPVSDTLIDWPAWIRLAQYCDENRTWNVNGETFTSARHTFDAVIDYTTSIKELLESVLSSCRSSLVITQSGKYSVMIDEEKTVPRQLLTAANCWNFSGARTFLDDIHALIVTFVDAENNYTKNEVIVYRDGYSSTNAVNFENVGTFGITDHYRAWAFGRYFMAQAIQRSETLTFTMSIENLVIQRGDLVHVQQDVAWLGGRPARVIRVDTTTKTIEVDTDIQQMAYGPIAAYRYTVRLQNGTIRSGAVAGAGPDVYSWILDDVTGMETENLIVIGIDKQTIPYLVHSVVPEKDLTASVSLVVYNPGVYTADIGAIPPWNGNMTPFRALYP